MFERYWQVEGYVPIPLSDKEYLIDNDGNVVDKNGQPISTTTDEEGFITVFVKLWGGWKHYRVVDISALVFKKIKIPFKFYPRIEGFHIDGNKQNLHASNVGYRFRGGPLEHPKKKGYFYIPFRTNYVVNRDGVVFNLLTRYSTKWYITKRQENGRSKQGYYVSNSKDDLDHRTNFSRHRSVALALIPYPDNVDDLDVNHINGIPGSDNVTNLEFVTRKENSLHAQRLGLNNSIPVLVRNVVTKEVNEYYSIAEAARVLGLACDESVRFRLRQPFGTVFQGGIQVKYKNDDRPWTDVVDPEKAIEDARQQIPVACRNVLTGDQFYTHSMVEAAELMKMSYSVVKLRLRRGLKQAIDGWQFQYAEGQPLVWKDVSPEDVRWMPKMTSVERHDVQTGETLVFKSMKKAGRSTPKGSTVPLYLRKGFQPLYHGRYRFKYKNDVWRVSDMIDYGSITDAALAKLPNRGSTANSTWVQQTQ